MTWSIVGRRAFRTSSSGWFDITAAGLASLALPSGTTAGDVVYAVITHRGSGTVTVPAGWDKFYEQLDASTTTGALPSLVVARVVVGGSAPSLDFPNITSPIGHRLIFVTYRNSAGAAVLAGTADQTYTSSVTAIELTGGVTTTDPNELLFGVAAQGAVTTSSNFDATDPATASGTSVSTTDAPSTAGWTNRYIEGGTIVGGSLNFIIADGVKATAGSTGTISATGGSSRQSRIVVARTTISSAGTAPSITTQPTDQEVVQPDSATFIGAASGSGTLTYQWQRSTNDGADWTNISGATSSSYTTPGTLVTGGSANNGDQYRFIVTGDTSPPATSDAALLTVTASSEIDPPAGTVTISAVDPDVTTAAVTYSYSATDQENFEFRIDAGAPDAIGASPATLTGLTAATTYEVQVRATNTGGVGAWSTAFEFTTDAAPTVPLLDFSSSIFRVGNIVGALTGIGLNAGLNLLMRAHDPATGAVVATRSVVATDEDAYIPNWGSEDFTSGAWYEVRIGTTEALAQDRAVALVVMQAET